MPPTTLSPGNAVTSMIAARSTTQTAPVAGDTGVVMNDTTADLIALFTYASTITTPPVCRWYTRPSIPGGGGWFKAASTSDAGFPLQGVNEARIFPFSAGLEVLLIVETAPTGGGTVAVDVLGVRE